MSSSHGYAGPDVDASVLCAPLGERVLSLSDVLSDELVTLEEAARLAGMAKQTIVNQRYSSRRGVVVRFPVPEEFGVVRIGRDRTTVFRRVDIEAWVVDRNHVS